MLKSRDAYADLDNYRRTTYMPDIFARIVSLRPADEDCVVELCFASPSAGLVFGCRILQVRDSD